MHRIIARNSILSAMLHGLVILSILLALLPQLSAAAEPSSKTTDPSGVPEGLTTAEWQTVQGLIRQAEYQPTWHAPSAAYTAPNPANRLRLASAGPAQSWTWSLALAGCGAPGAVRPLAGAELPEVDAHRVTYRHPGGLAEWYVNGARGLEQGFTIAALPAGAVGSQLVLDMSLRADLVPQLAPDGQSVTFHRPEQAGLQAGTEVLRYDGLLVVDATSATYPITIDPLMHTDVAKLTASDAANGDWTGYSVAISGGTVVVGPLNKGDGGDLSRRGLRLHA